jgi:hypothetical protein
MDRDLVRLVAVNLLFLHGHVFGSNEAHYSLLRDVCVQKLSMIHFKLPESVLVSQDLAAQEVPVERYFFE